MESDMVWTTCSQGSIPPRADGSRLLSGGAILWGMFYLAHQEPLSTDHSLIILSGLKKQKYCEQTKDTLQAVIINDYIEVIDGRFLVFLLISLFHTQPHLLSLVSGVRGQQGVLKHICLPTHMLQKTTSHTPNWPQFQLIVSRMKRKPWLTLKAIDPLSFTLLHIDPPTHNVFVKYLESAKLWLFFLKHNYGFDAWEKMQQFHVFWMVIFLCLWSHNVLICLTQTHVTLVLKKSSLFFLLCLFYDDFSPSVKVQKTMMHPVVTISF